MGVSADILRLESCASTNTELLRLAETGAPAFTTVVAKHQSAGRGRAGHTWEAPAGTALLFSTLLRPRVTVETLPLATIAVGIAVCEAIRAETGLPAGLKWPNDVLVHGRKCAGILCEGVPPRAGASAAIVAGVGINLTTPREFLPSRPIFPATSLALEGAPPPNPDTLLLRILDNLRLRLSHLEFPDEGRTLVARFRELDALKGRVLRAELPDGTSVEGPSLGISEDGSLQLQTPHGPLSILAGSIFCTDGSPATHGLP